VAKSRGAAFGFTCPECFVKLKAWPSQVGSHQTCPSCSATIQVPPAPEPAHGPSQYEPTLPAPDEQTAGEYEIIEGDRAPPAGDGFRVICPVCRARIDATWDEVGRTIVCPDCDTPVPVTPPADSASARSAPMKIDEQRIGQYGIDERAGAADHARPSPAEEGFPVYCSLCRTMMYATADQVGRKLTCPDCQTQTVVPPPPKRRGPVDVAAQSRGEYGVGSPRQPAAAGPDVIPVVCSLCGTRMHARAKHVGRKIKCPDCGTATVVSLPKEVEAARPDETLDEYAVRQEPAGAESSPATPPAREIPVVCPLCQTRMMAAGDQTGQIMECPDCGSTVTVPKPEPAARPAEDQLDTEGDYAVGAPAETIERQPAKTYQESWRNERTEELVRDLEAGNTGWTLPDLYDKLGFLGDPRAMVRWVGLSVALMAFYATLGLGVVVASGPGGGETLFLGMAFIAVSSIFLLFWFAVASTFCLSIVEDSAAGNERIESWPDEEWSGWILDSLYVFFALAVSSLLGWVVVRWVPGAGSWGGAIVSFCVFPVVLLSMLEQSSMFSPFSEPIWASLWFALGSWLFFYLRAALLLGLVVIAQRAVEHLLGLFGLVPLAAFYVAAMFIYARWLGRLAAHCREVMAVEEEEEE